MVAQENTADPQQLFSAHLLYHCDIRHLLHVTILHFVLPSSYLVAIVKDQVNSYRFDCS